MKRILAVFLCAIVIPHAVSAQDRMVDFKEHCSSSTSCNPFLAGVICNNSEVRTTHGSPAFNNITDKRVLLNARTASGGLQYGEGFTIAYPFQAGKEYKITVKHQGFLPPGGGSLPILVIALTNQPERFDDGCSEGYLTTTNTYISFDAYPSLAASTAIYSFIPDQDLQFLWLRSKPQGAQQNSTGVMIYSVDFDDKSVSNPGPGIPTTPPYYCYSTINFCRDTEGHNIRFGATSPIYIDCDIFDNLVQIKHSLDTREIAATEITLGNGFMANASPSKDGQVRWMWLAASADPCHFFPTSNNTTQAQAYKLPPDIKPAIKRTPLAELTIYPSVTNGTVNITGITSIRRGAAIVVLDQSGRIVHQSRNSSENNPVTLNLSHLANGMYFIKVSTAEKTATQKIIIKK